MPSAPAPAEAEHDVVVCWREPGGRDLALETVAYLRGRGFHVFAAAGGEEAERARRAVEETPDLVLVVTPGALEPCQDADDPLARLLLRALGTERNIVPLVASREQELSAAALPRALEPLSRLTVVWYLEGVGHKAAMATLAHRLSSETTLGERRDERRVKRWFLAAAAVLLTGFALQTVPLIVEWWTRPRPKPPLPPFALYWAGHGQRLEAGRWVAFELAAGAPVSAGDRVRVSFSPSANGHAYVLARDAAGGISVLFPPEGLANASRVKAGQAYQAPAGPDWFEVNAAGGLDALYVIAGYDPYQNLEELVERPERELTPGECRELLELTLRAVRDSRDAPGDRVRTRTLQTIDRALPPGPGPGVSQVTLADGVAVARPLKRETGLVSALAELRFRQEAEGGRR